MKHKQHLVTQDKSIQRKKNKTTPKHFHTRQDQYVKPLHSEVEPPRQKVIFTKLVLLLRS